MSICNLSGSGNLGNSNGSNIYKYKVTLAFPNKLPSTTIIYDYAILTTFEEITNFQSLINYVKKYGSKASFSNKYSYVCNCINLTCKDGSGDAIVNFDIVCITTLYGNERIQVGVDSYDEFTFTGLTIIEEIQ